MDTSRDVRDSVKDIHKRLRKKTRGIEVTCTDPDVRVMVEDRGIGSRSLGYAGTFSADSERASGEYSERRERQMWVRASIHVRSGTGYEMVRQLEGRYRYEVSNPQNPYGSLGALGAWGKCADQILDDTVEWLAANARQVLARRRSPR